MSRKHVDLDDLENVDDVDEEIEELDDMDMEDMPSLFWSLAITPGKEAPIEDPGVGFLIHITNACFGTSVTKDSRTVVICKVEDKEIPICVLREGSYENHQLDLLFSDPAAFVLKGNKPSAVVLTGYLQPDTPNVGGMGGPDSLMGDEFNVDDLDDEDIAAAIKKAKRGKPSIDENEDENEDANKDAPQLLDESTEIPQSKTANDNNVPPKESKKKKKKKNKKAQQEQKVEQTEEKTSNDTPVENKNNDDKNKNKDNDDKNKDKNKMIKMNNGIQYKDMKEGTGPEIKHGQQVCIYYVGQDTSSQVFDKQLSGDGFKFHFGKGEVIKGWDLGLKGMKVGGKRKLIVPAKFAYGKEGKDNIKPNEDLTFTVEIKSIS